MTGEEEEEEDEVPPPPQPPTAEKRGAVPTDARAEIVPSEFGEKPEVGLRDATSDVESLLAPKRSTWRDAICANSVMAEGLEGGTKGACREGG